MGQATPASQPEMTAEEQARELRYAEALLDGEQTHLHAIYGNYIHNFLKHTKRTTTTAFMICNTLEKSMKGVNFGRGKKFPQQEPGAKGAVYERKYAGKKEVSEADWKTLTDYFGKFKDSVEIPEDDSVFKNLIRLTEILGLGEMEKKPLQLLYVAKQYPELGTFLESVFESDLKKASIGIARMLDAPLEGRRYFSAMTVGSRMSRYGLVYFEQGGNATEIGIPCVDEQILDKFDKPMNDDEVAAVLLGNPAKSELGIEDFSHVGDQLEFVLKLIKKAVDNGEKGINVFLHGPAGSGKTELAGAIAKHLGLRLFSVGEPNGDDPFGEEYTDDGAKRPASEVRTTKLLRTQALLDGSKNSLVLFDEIEDLLMKGTDSSKSADTDNKLQVNRLLETNPVVTIWTGNNPEKFHEAVRQRFTYSILMDYPPTLVREKVWKRRLEMEKATLPPEEIRTLAREYAAPARMISKAVRSMRIVDGDVNVIRRSLEADSKIGFGQTDSILIEEAIPKDFSLDFLNADKNLHDMFNRLVGRGVEKKPFSLLVKADPETGAENILRMMAEDMVMNPLEISMAELCAPHPMMGPAQKFAMAFNGAADARQFLIITGLEDVVGGADEENPDWKSGLVELFSAYALKHRRPFAVTIKPDAKLPKHIEMLFSDNVQLNAMVPDQAATLYNKIFGQSVPEERTKDLTGLSAEDFIKARAFMVRLDQVDVFDHDRVIELLHRFKDRRANPKAPVLGF
ncbi:MAG: AAA family ATPase [Micavibrio sp.]